MVDIRDALFEQLYELGKEDPDVVILTADADAFALRKFKQEFPDRFYNMGVAEQNTILFATGLAMGGKKVFIYSIIPFITMRCFEQIKAQICSMNLPITIIGLGAGLSFSFDGPTHHALQDIGVMYQLPEMTIFNPSDNETAQTAITSAYIAETPHYIRLDKGVFPDNPGYVGADGIRQWTEWMPNGVNIITTGTMLHTVKKAVEGLNVGIIDVYRLKPFPDIVSDYTNEGIGYTLVVEEYSEVGGLYDLVKRCTEDSSALIQLALPHKQLFDYGEREWILEKYGLSQIAIRNKVEELL